MQQKEVTEILLNQLNFQKSAITKLEKYIQMVLEYNNKRNLISKNTENDIWKRHVLDSAQLVSRLDNFKGVLADFGSGAGFPGIIIDLFNVKNQFHVKLYEKSPVKRNFLNVVIQKLSLKATVHKNVYEEDIEADIIVCRAFKKLSEIIKISREIRKKSHKIIILKGRNAQKEINTISLENNYSYKLEDSLTDKDSKIIVLNKNK